MLLSTITRKTDSVYHICHAFCTFVNVILYNRTWHASYKGMKWKNCMFRCAKALYSGNTEQKHSWKSKSIITTKLFKLHLKPIICKRVHLSPYKCLLTFYLSTFYHQQIGTRKQHIQLVEIFRKSPISNFSKAKCVFDDFKSMFYFATYSGFLFWSDTFPDPVSSLHFWLNSVQK